MKKILFIVFVFVFATTLSAQPPAGPANAGDTYGEKITAGGAISLADLAQKLKKNEVVQAKVKGTVTEVCSMKGCWMKMELPDKSQMQIKFKNYGFFVPTALIGKTVVIDGTAKQKIVSVNELKHFAEDAKKSKEEIEAITKPEKQVKFEASGVLVI